MQIAAQKFVWFIIIIIIIINGGGSGSGRATLALLFGWLAAPIEVLIRPEALTSPHSN